MSKKLRTSQAAQRVGVCQKTIRRWIRAGRLQAARTPGGEFRIDEDELARVTSYPSPLGEF